jgi:colanic acid biosynthesis glycosyl transferase WcaI
MTLTNRILLIGGNYFPEPTGIGKYNGEMIDWLANQGYECGVITTFPYYPYWKVQAPYATRSSWYRTEKRSLYDNVPIKVYRCPHYVPVLPGGKNRLFSDLTAFISFFFQLLLLLFKKKYDIVIAVAPPFQLGLLGLLYKKIRGAKFIYHIQDLQIDAASELGMIKSASFTKLLFGIERFIIKNADHVSSISEGMIKKIKSKFKRPVILFPNWADTELLYPIKRKEELKARFGYSASDTIVLYSGAIGEKQGLQMILHTANQIRTNPAMKFIICGSGPYQQRLVDLAGSMELTNVDFMPLQDKETFNDFLNLADVHLVMQKADVKDLVMPSKLTSIFSVGGLALVTAVEGTNLHSLISQHNMGILIDPEDQQAMLDALIQATDESHDHVRENARRYAENHLSIDMVLTKFLTVIMEDQIYEEVADFPELVQVLD